MASHAPITGAPTRAPAFPDLAPLDSATAVLASVDGALIILASHLEASAIADGDAVGAAYTAGAAVMAARAKLSQLGAELLAYRNAREGR